MIDDNFEIVEVFREVPILDITPLPMSAPVLFFAPLIDIAIERGISRLRSHVQVNPMSEEWITFGWLDGGLTSSIVNLPIGAFRMIEGFVEFAPYNKVKFIPHFSINFDYNWDDIVALSKKTLIQGFDQSYQIKKLELLQLANLVNIDPDK